MILDPSIQIQNVSAVGMEQLELQALSLSKDPARALAMLDRWPVAQTEAFDLQDTDHQSLQLLTIAKPVDFGLPELLFGFRCVGPQIWSQEEPATLVATYARDYMPIDSHGCGTEPNTDRIRFCLERLRGAFDGPRPEDSGVQIVRGSQGATPVQCDISVFDAHFDIAAIRAVLMTCNDYPFYEFLFETEERWGMVQWAHDYLR